MISLHANQSLKGFILAVSVGLSLLASGQTGILGTNQIPDGVHYKPASDALNASAIALLKQSLLPANEPPKVFFDSAVTCGPSLWKVLQPSADKVLLDSKLVVVVVNSVQTEGRGLITDEQRQSFWQLLLTKYPALQGAAIRKANAEEIKYYWATIPFDIEEPFFTIDTGTTKFIVNFRVEKGSPKLFWIDEVGDLQKLTSEPGKVVNLTVLTMMAEGGDAASMLQLAKGYWFGTSIPPDVDKARIWFDRASEKGSLDAQMFLWMAYFAGVKLPKDRNLSAKYLKLAANQRNAMAQYYMGIMYRDGEGVEQSNENAVNYLQMAANKNYAPADYDLGVIYETGKGVFVNKKMACQLYGQAAQQGHIMATNSLGQCYVQRGTQDDLETAKDLFTKAANAGNRAAQSNLSALYGEFGDWQNSYIWARIAQGAGASQGFLPIDRIKLHLTQLQIDSAEDKILEWQEAHPAKK
ncbi:MAG: tetratricopeptide repeat protein [Terracidiphilus sp.]|jgi:TPR repeat protein